MSEGADTIEDDDFEMSAPQPSEIPATPQQMRLAVAAAQDRKADALQVLNLSAVSDFTELFLICSGSNERQVQAIADAIVEELRRAGVRPLHVEGLQHGRWVLLDYGGDMVIHVFLDATREFYALERLWSDAPDETDRYVTES